MLKRLLVIIGLLLKAVNLVLEDRRFELPSTSATAARNIAEELILWQKDPGHANVLVFNQFATYLSAKLKLCFVTTHKTKHLKQAKMWGEYHKLRTSAGFKAEWQKFLDKAVKQQPSVAFYQFVTHELFKELIKMEFTVDTEKDNKTLSPLTHEEKNALRYVAGYVCRKVHDRLKQSSCPGREVMMLCLSDMNGGDIDEDNHTDEWLRKINRGGLWNVTDEVYQLFYIMEVEMKQRLSGDSLADSKKAEIIEDLLQNEDLLFQWGLM